MAMVKNQEREYSRIFCSYIAGRAKLMGITNEAIAKKIGMPVSTLGTKKRQTGKITLSNLRKMRTELKLTDEEILKIVRGEK